MLCLGFSVMGMLGPVTEKPVPTAWTAKSLILQARGLVSTMESAAEDPTETCPKERDAGLAFTASLLTPEPKSASERVGLDALLEKVILPPVHPIFLGANVTCKESVWPGGKTTGRLSSYARNSEPVTVMAEILVELCPVLVRTTSWVSV